MFWKLYERYLDKHYNKNEATLIKANISLQRAIIMLERRAIKAAKLRDKIMKMEKDDDLFKA